ncbi:MAG TPA: hypothetical protein VG365_14275 [Solirubrobacteraceae bacterium]|nr:hypothetical protein [Solirubrobacteraceae bacterium]
MRLARAWRRQIFEASLAAVLIPAAIIVSVAVLASGGNLRRIGAISQVITGPAVPGSAAAGRGRGSGTRPVPATSIDRLASSIALRGQAARPVRLHVPSGTGRHAGRGAHGSPGSGHGASGSVAARGRIPASHRPAARGRISASHRPAAVRPVVSPLGRHRRTPKGKKDEGHVRQAVTAASAGAIRRQDGHRGDGNGGPRAQGGQGLGDGGPRGPGSHGHRNGGPRGEGGQGPGNGGPRGQGSHGHGHGDGPGSSSRGDG